MKRRNSPKNEGEEVLAEEELKPTVTQIANPVQSSGKQKVLIDPEGDREKAVRSVSGPQEGQIKMAFVSRGQLTVAFTELESVRYIEQPDGSKIKRVIPAPRLDFPNCVGETTDPMIIEATIKHPRFGKDFYYHVKFLPKDATPQMREKAIEFADVGKDFLKEMVERREKAKSFDKLAHPEEGVSDPINPVTGKPDSGMEW